jgi:hypothetical protein
MDPVIFHVANHGTDTEPAGYIKFTDGARIKYVHTHGIGLAVLPPSDGRASAAHARVATAALAAEFPDTL